MSPRTLGRAPRAVRLLVALGAAVAPLALGGPARGADRPIQHVVMLMQENHTFDNYFSAFPGVDAPPASVCMPTNLPQPAPTKKPKASPTPRPVTGPSGSIQPGASAKPAPGVTAKPGTSAKPGPTASPSPNATPSRPPVGESPGVVPSPNLGPSSGTNCTKRFHLDSHRTVDLNHSDTAALRAYNGGLMNGFASAQDYYNLPGNLSMGYYDARDLPLYYNLASQYVLAERFFSSAWGSSEINHMYSIAARGGGAVPKNGYTFPTIFDRLEDAGVSWKFYVQNYDPTITFRNPASSTAKSAQLIWAPLLNFSRFIDDPKLSSHIVDLSQYFTDLEKNQLPAVAFLAPSGLSEHPPGDITVGQTFAISTVTSLMRSKAWDSSFYALTWDDWGGWYDHVQPPVIDADGPGFRVPAIFVSPYAKTGTIDDTTYDFTSILRFIEDNWSLQPLTARDASANSVANALDLSREPAAPVFPAETFPVQVSRDTHNRPLLLAIYGAVAAFALIGAAGAFLLRPSRRRQEQPR